MSSTRNTSRNFASQVGEGFVQEKELGLAHDGAPDCDALHFAAGQVRGRSVQKRGDAKQVGGVGNSVCYVCFGEVASGCLEWKCEVLAHGFVGIE